MSLRARMVRSTIALGWLLAAGACGSAERPTADTLAGTWSARFDLGESEKLPLPTRERSVQGSLTLAEGGGSPAGQPAPGPARPVTAGSFAIDFVPLGFTLGGSQAIAWYGTAPALSIILRPDMTRGNIAIAGIQKGDEIAGQWTLLDDPARASGTVVLTRGQRK